MSEEENKDIEEKFALIRFYFVKYQNNQSTIQFDPLTDNIEVIDACINLLEDYKKEILERIKEENEHKKDKKDK